MFLNSPEEKALIKLGASLFWITSNMKQNFNNLFDYVKLKALKGLLDFTTGAIKHSFVYFSTKYSS
jgi:hypothetical protein